MALVLHVSDLHLHPRPDGQEAIVASMLDAVGRAFAGARADLVAVTGDVFDSADRVDGEAVARFASLLREIDACVGGDVPTVVIPGNHDRRRTGNIGPDRPDAFRLLARALGDRPHVHVFGNDTPFLASLVPDGAHRVPAHLVAYDTTYLPRGLLGAGGTIEHEDLLRVAGELPRDGKPVIVLMHHHLVPTPVTDVASILDEPDATAAQRFLVKHVISALVSNADREELTMTALGAGTALTTLHALGRAVIVLHGHKHYPTVRLLRATLGGDGDVLIASAGSAGLAETWSPSRHPEAAALRPSFNLVEIHEARVEVTMVTFARRDAGGEPRQRMLVKARRAGARWESEPVSATPDGAAPMLARDEATWRLADGSTAARWDATCTRVVEPAAAWPSGKTYRDVVEGISGARVVVGARSLDVPAAVDLAIGGATTFEMRAGLCRTLAEGARAYGEPAAFESVEMVCPWPCARASLRLEGHEGVVSRAFASVTDMATGREAPSALVRETGTAAIALEPCPRKTRLRIYWPLERR